MTVPQILDRRGQHRRRARAASRRRWVVGAIAVGAIVLSAVLLTARPGAAAAAAANRHTHYTALTKAISRVLRRASIPGAIVGVWQQGYRPYTRAFGVRNVRLRQPMSTHLYMRIGSETKTFTITALLQLVDRHKIRLDDPIARYISGVPHGRTITLRELAEMRSGLFNYTNDGNWTKAFLAHPRRQWKPSQLLRYAFRHKLMFKPGSKYYYSNTNTILLGLVIQKVSHTSLARFIERNILRPLHLTHTMLPAGAYFPRPHAVGYTKLAPGTPVLNATSWNPSWGWAAGAMFSTLGDLHVWAKDVATGNLLTRATQRQRERFLPVPFKGVRAGYGLGLFRINGWIGHNGSLPGYQSLTIYLPSQRATVVVLLNSDIPYEGNELTTLVGTAITRIITPHHVFRL
ncbi:MAG: serine hydrolase domain-containing protein [Streptosporangiaceae bacterium]